MRPRKDDDALVDVLDVLLRDGVIVRADVIVSVADVPLIGIKLTAAIAGMETMTEYGLFEEWDREHRRRGITRREHSGAGSRSGSSVEDVESIAAAGADRRLDGSRSERADAESTREEDPADGTETEE